VRAALEGAASRTRAYAVTTARAPRWPLLAAALGAAVVVGVLLAVLLPNGSPPRRTAARAHTPVARTHVGTPSAAAPDPHSLNDRAWALMQQGRYAAALPLLERAVPALRGAGPGDPFEGYANYNLGSTLLHLGRCSDALQYLERARALEPERPEVQSALTAAQQCLAPPPQKHEKREKGGHGRGKQKGHD
jgi:tetratricopeptide (TPR) repeat protein